MVKEGGANVEKMRREVETLTNRLRAAHLHHLLPETDREDDKEKEKKPPAEHSPALSGTYTLWWFL